MASKSVWNLPGGPWERLFAGVWNRFNVAVYENSDKILLTTIFPKSGEVSWIMIRVDKILLAPAGIESIENQLQSKNMHILKQQIPERRMTYLILLSPPTTVEFGSSEIGSKVFQKVLSLNEEAEEIKAIAKKARVDVIDLKDAPYKESASILGNPTLLLSLLSITPEEEGLKKEKLKELFIGESGDGLFKVDEGMFSSYVSIKKGTEEERNYLAQALIEGAIMDVAPIPIIMDFGNYPLKLDRPNPYPYDYAKYGLAGRNPGFKISYYDLSQEDCPLKINLNRASPQFIWKLLGLGTDEASTLILQAANKLQQSGIIDGIESIEEEIAKTRSSRDKDKAVRIRAFRMLRTIKIAYGKIFSSKSDVRDLMHTWVKNNETVYISLSKLDARKRLVFLLYLLETLGKAKESGLFSGIENKRAEHIFLALLDMSWFGNGLLQSEIVDRILTSRPGALLVSEGDLPMELESRVAYRFHITAPKRAKLFLGGRGKEFDIRPLLSCPP